MDPDEIEGLAYNPTRINQELCRVNDIEEASHGNYNDVEREEDDTDSDDDLDEEESEGDDADDLISFQG
jgi:hypothetical protein